ncbi:MAG TPA: tetratricopeptide repeat protein [Bryobacteraceae bacterium]|jgi:tetratricopeptide (TPR) repeat protein
MCKRHRCLTVTSLACIAVAAFGAGLEQQPAKELPVGLVLSPNGSKLLRADTETALAARSGDLLFVGDGLRTDAGAATFLFCPSKAIETLGPSGEVRMEAKLPRVKTGKISEQPARSCTLPSTLRVEVASQQHYGVTMTRGANKPEIPPVPQDQLTADVKAAIAPFETVLAGDAKDQGALVSEATVFETHNLPANALETYEKLLAQWPEAVWVKSKIFDLEQILAAQAAVTAATGKGGKTYALLVGISKYKKPELSLQFAHEDANLFDKLLESPLGGGLPPDQIQLLVNEQATTAAVRNGFQDFLKRRAGKDDTVVILVAGHGTVEVPGSKNAFILTYDTDPQDLTSTALPMAELRALFEDQLTKVGRVLLFVDVCKAGTIGTIQNTTVSADVQQLGDAQGDLFGLLASRPKEVSLEGPQFGGGHGVFSYYVVKGLEGAADYNKDGAVDADELIKYVSEMVPEATQNKQHPREFGTYEDSMKISDLSKTGTPLAQFPMLFDSRRGEPLFLAQNSPQGVADDPQTVANLAAFNSAIAAGRLLPGAANGAFQSLQALQSELSPERYVEVQNRLRVALENRAQEVLLRYLAGDQSPQAKDDFAQGARYMEAARMLTQESLFLEGRENFFDGRALLFDKNFTGAAAMLEQSVRIDPAAAYGYNALGIAYLEQAQFDKAIPAFRDASKRAQHWSYPLHNEALAYTEMGDFSAAVRAYQQAMRLTPQYSYLPYNLGLVYQRMNRKKDAETSYRKAMLLAPDSAEPYNALGTLKASEGKPMDAEQLYRNALQKNPSLLAARHNLALLLIAEKGRRAEAIALWRENLMQSPDDLPSHLSLAEALAQDGDTAGAIEQYRRVLALKPDYIAAHLALAQLLAKNSDPEGALAELRSAAAADPKNPAILEQIGDVEAARGRAAEARSAYQSALGLSPESAAKKRLNQKLKALPK